MHELIPIHDRAAWEGALEGVEHAFGHRWDSCHAFFLTSAAPTYLYRYRTPSFHVVLPLAVRTFGATRDIVSPYGFAGFTSAGSAPDWPKLWRDFASRQGWVCGYIAQHPSLALHHSFAYSTVHTKTAYVIDLSKGETELTRRLSQNRRRQMRGWSGHDIVDDTDALLRFVLRQRHAFYAERDAAATYDFAETTWRALAASEATLLVGKRIGDEIVAASMFAFSGRIGDYLFNISNERGRASSAELVWEGARRLMGRGVLALNLGGGIREGDGVAMFKARFGPDRLPLLGLRQIYDRAQFEALCRSADVSPDGEYPYFPPYRIAS